MNAKIADHLRFKAGFVNQSLATVKNTEWVSLENAGRVLAHIFSAQTANDQHVTVQFQQATASDGSGATNVGAAIDAEALVNGEKFSTVAELRADQMSDGYTHARATVVESGSPTPGLTASCGLVLGENRYNP